MYCEKCGHAIANKNANYCGNCGVKLAGSRAGEGLGESILSWTEVAKEKAKSSGHDFVASMSSTDDRIKGWLLAFLVIYCFFGAAMNMLGGVLSLGAMYSFKTWGYISEDDMNSYATIFSVAVLASTSIRLYIAYLIIKKPKVARIENIIGLMLVSGPGLYIFNLIYQHGLLGEFVRVEDYVGSSLKFLLSFIFTVAWCAYLKKSKRVAYRLGYKRMKN